MRKFDRQNNALYAQIRDLISAYNKNKKTVLIELKSRILPPKEEQQLANFFNSQSETSKQRRNEVYEFAIESLFKEAMALKICYVHFVNESRLREQDLLEKIEKQTIMQNFINQYNAYMTEQTVKSLLELILAIIWENNRKWALFQSKLTHSLQLISNRIAEIKDFIEKIKEDMKLHKNDFMTKMEKDITAYIHENFKCKNDQLEIESNNKIINISIDDFARVFVHHMEFAFDNHDISSRKISHNLIENCVNDLIEMVPKIDNPKENDSIKSELANIVGAFLEKNEAVISAAVDINFCYTVTIERAQETLDVCDEIKRTAISCKEKEHDLFSPPDEAMFDVFGQLNLLDDIDNSFNIPQAARELTLLSACAAKVDYSEPEEPKINPTSHLHEDKKEDKNDQDDQVDDTPTPRP